MQSTSVWPELTTDLVTTINAEWDASDGGICLWAKDLDGTLVSDFEVRIDLATRRLLSHYYPGIPVLSEELGWLRSLQSADSALAAVLDPVDGTESLAQGIPSWWVSVAICESRVPVVGLVHQPVRRVTHDSRRPSGVGPEPTGRVGLSPDQVNSASSASRRLRKAGLEPTATPHAVEKVISVLEGRCDAAVYVPSSKSPDWRSWDIAACVCLSEANGLSMRPMSGGAFVLPDLAASFTEPWICARNADLWDAVRTAVGDTGDAHAV